MIRVILDVSIVLFALLTAYKCGWHRGWRVGWNDYQAIVEHKIKKGATNG